MTQVRIAPVFFLSFWLFTTPLKAVEVLPSASSHPRPDKITLLALLEFVQSHSIPEIEQITGKKLSLTRKLAVRLLQGKAGRRLQARLKAAEEDDPATIRSSFARTIGLASVACFALALASGGILFTVLMLLGSLSALVLGISSIKKTKYRSRAVIGIVSGAAGLVIFGSLLVDFFSNY
jgi:hypothetical protein